MNVMRPFCHAAAHPAPVLLLQIGQIAFGYMNKNKQLNLTYRNVNPA